MKEVTKLFALAQGCGGLLGDRKKPGFIALVGSCLAAASTLGGAAIGDISDPEWYQQAENKILVLEYDNPRGKPWGEQLSQLIGNTTLGTLTGVPSAAVIILRQEDEPVELNDATIGEIADRQNTPVAIWGEFYEQDGLTFVYSHIHFLPEVESGTQGMHLEINRDSSLSSSVGTASAILPTRQINFAPIEVSLEVLDELEETWERSFRLLGEPRDDAPQTGELVPKRQYYVLETRGDWTRFLVKDGGEGWAQVGNVFSRDEIWELNGLVLYAQGLLQYSAKQFAAGKNSFETYLEKYAANQDAMNRGMAHILFGYCVFYDESLLWRQRLSKAKAAFEEAAKLMPNAASPINCLALMSFYEWMRDDHVEDGDIKQLEKRLIRAIQTESDIHAVRNLKTLYSLPNANSYFSIDQSTFQQRKADRMALLNSLETNFLNDQTNRSVVELSKSGE